MLSEIAVKERALGPLAQLMWKRLNRVSVRFASLLAAFREDRLRPPRPRPPRPEPGDEGKPVAETGSTSSGVVQPKTAPQEKPRVPHQSGWILQTTQAAAAFGSQLRLCKTARVRL